MPIYRKILVTKLRFLTCVQIGKREYFLYFPARTQKNIFYGYYKKSCGSTNSVFAKANYYI